jgi:hypothetical protein
MKVGRTCDAAEARLLLRLAVDAKHDHVAADCAAFVSRGDG